MKGRYVRYTQDELAWVEANATLCAPDFHAAFLAAFGRSDVSQDQLVALRKRKGLRTGRTGRFAPGQQSPNKGRKGYCPPGCEKGWFKKGERRGVANHVYKPIGTERRSKDGYLERKVHDGMPLKSRWRAVHLINWEATNGAVPRGSALKCLDGNRLNVDPSNWIAIPRALLPRLIGSNGRGKRRLAYDDAPQELKPTILATARLAQHARARATS